MEVMWNKINLARPPYRSWDISIKEFDVDKFFCTIEKILNEFKILEVLHSEGALLSRLIYRMKSKFRSDKGLKYMEKVNRALLNYLNMSIEEEYKHLKEYVEINNGTVNLPPRQTLEYILVRTQGFAKLMCRIESTSMIAARLLKLRMQTGQSWYVAILAYGVISRIWSLSRYIIRRVCEWYQNVYKYAATFKIVGIPWLPDNYTLPENLSCWLNLPWIHENVEKSAFQENWGNSIFKLIETKTDETNLNIDDNTIIEKIQNSEAKSDKPIPPESKLICKQEDDIGKHISRISFEKSSQNTSVEKIKRVKKCKKDKCETTHKQYKELDVKSEKDLVRLLKVDSISGLDKLQWRILQKRIKKLLIKLTKNNTCAVDDKLLHKVNQRIRKWMNAW